jgi:hypothetical protein
MTLTSINAIVMTVVLVALVFFSRDIFARLVKLNRYIRLKMMIRKFRADQPAIIKRDKPVHVGTTNRKEYK